MEFAYDPASRSNVNVDQYKELYGPKLDERGQFRRRPTLRCLACDVTLHTVAEDSATPVRTWGHDPSPGTYCPVKSEGGERYELLPPVEADPLAGARTRAGFFQNWQTHWGYIRGVAALADIFTLIGFLRAADRTRFWDQRHLEEWHLPYVFLSTCEFPPPSGVAAAHRPEWLRFRFDGRYRTLQDLWIRGEPNFRVLRLRYQAPARKRDPRPADFIAAEPVPASATWQAGGYAPVKAFQVAQMERAFPAELGAAPR
jgi:hypothetical protein